MTVKIQAVFLLSHTDTQHAMFKGMDHILRPAYSDAEQNCVASRGMKQGNQDTISIPGDSNTDTSVSKGNNCRKIGFSQFPLTPIQKHYPKIVT